MKHTALAAGLLALCGLGSVGCKSAPKLAWWKSDKTAEATAIAHSAPTLPSEAAKKGEASANAAQLAGGTAAPFTPSAVRTPAGAGTGYPSTAAPPFSATAASQPGNPASSVLAQQTSSANLGSIGMPYDPAATPKPRIAATTPSTAAPSTPDRYGSSFAGAASAPAYSAPTYSTAVAPPAGQGVAAAPAPGGASTDVIATTPLYGGFPAGSRYGAATGPATSAVGAATNAVSGATNQYAAATGAAADAASAARNAASNYQTTAIAGVTPYIPPAPVVGTTPSPGVVTPAANTAPVGLAGAQQPYRPGGTTSYPGVQVASRPTATTPAPAATTAPTSPTTPPNGAAPASTTTAPRYW